MAAASSEAFSFPQYPGAFGVPLDADDSCRPNGVDGTWEAELITAREMQMMGLMNALTDKPDWSRKIYDDNVLSNWRAEAKAMPNSLIEDEQFDYCLQELKFEADQLDKCNVISALDGEAMVVKSDTLVKPDLHRQIGRAYQQLASTVPVDWHPRSDDKVRNLIHPSSYPLVYTTTRCRTDALADSPLASLSLHSGAGLVLPYPQDAPDYYSTDFQWLPCNVSLENGGAKITSTVNGLHPRRASAVYPVLEQLIHASIPAWNRCLQERSRRQDGQDHQWIKVDLGDQASSASMAEVSSGEEGDGDGADDMEDDYESDGERLLIHPRQCLPVNVRKAEKPGASINLEAQYSRLQVIVKMASIELTPEKPSFNQGSWHLEGQLNERIIATALYYFDCDNVTPSRIAFRERVIVEEDYQTQYQHEQSDYERWNQTFNFDFREGVGIQEIGMVETREGRVVAFPNLLQHRVSQFELADKTKPGHRRFIALWLVDPDAPVISTANVGPQQMDWWAGETLRRYSNLPSTRLELLEEILHTNRAVPRLSTEVVAMIYSYLDDKTWLMTQEEAQETRTRLMDERTVATSEMDDRIAEHTFFFCEH